MRIPALTVGGLVIALVTSLAISLPASATSVTIGSEADLVSAVGSGGTSTLSTDVSDPVLSLSVAGIVVLDLAGHTLTLERIQLQGGASLTVTNSGSTRGTLVADASNISGSAGIRTTNATLVVAGSIDVTATGGNGGAGIGGDEGSGAGTVKTQDSATVEATGKPTAAGIGAGKNGLGPGSLSIGGTSSVTVNADPSAPSAIGDSQSIGVVTIATDSTLVIGSGSVVNAQEPMGSGAKLANDGTIIVKGTLTGNGTTTTNTGSIVTTTLGTVSLTSVVGAAYSLTFDASPGTVPATTYTVFADTIAAGGKVLPTASAPSGQAFDSWTYAGSPVTATTSLSSLFGASTSSSTTKTITANYKSFTTVSLTPFSNRVPYGTAATLTASVTGGATGTVDFYDGTTWLGQSTVLSGTATLPVKLHAGDHSITAHYTGDATAGTSAATILTVTQASTSLALSLGRTSFSVGQTTGLTATITPSTAAGTVTFTAGGDTIGTATLSNGIATLQTSSSLAVGEYEIRASYAATSDFTFSLSPITVLDVTAATSSPTPTPTPSSTSTATGTNGTNGTNGTDGTNGTNGTSTTVGTHSTTTAVWLSTFATTYGTVVRATAHVADGATGTVLFSEGGRALGTAGVADGYATLDLPGALAVGPHVVTATYSGDSSYAASASVAGTLTITKAATSVKVTAKPFTKASKPKLTIAIAKGARGPVAIYVGSKKAKTVTVTKARTVVTLSKKYAKQITVKAIFVGTSSFTKATSKTVKVRAK